LNNKTESEQNKNQGAFCALVFVQFFLLFIIGRIISALKMAKAAIAKPQ
jgi:hypothetical protein